MATVDLSLTSIKYDVHADAVVEIINANFRCITENTYERLIISYFCNAVVVVLLTDI